MTTRIALGVIVCSLGLWLQPRQGAAQSLTPDRVQQAIELTDVRIEQATQLLLGSDNDQAHTEVDLATDLQARGKGALAAHQLSMAMTLTLQARGHADRAIAFIRGLPDPDRVWAQLDRTQDMLDQTQQRIGECNDDRVRAMVQVAVEIQARAQNAAQASRYLAALQLTMSARERALRALRLCRMEENLQDAADRALHRTDEIILRAHDAVGPGVRDAAREALARAGDVQGEAYRQFRAEHYDASLRLTTAARALAHRALRLAGGAS